MRKVYIELMPVMQYVKRENTEPHAYETMEGCRIHTETPIWFPITAVMECTREEGDEEEVILVEVGTDSEQTKANTELLHQELKDHGLSQTIKTVTVSQVQDNAMTEDLIRQLTGIIRQGDDIYVSATFGTKPMLIAMLYAIQIVETGLKDVEIQGIYYGEKTYQSKPERYRFYDLSSLYFLGQVVGSIEPGDEEHLQDVLESMFALRH